MYSACIIHISNINARCTHATPPPLPCLTHVMPRGLFRGKITSSPRQPPTRQSWSGRFYPPKLASLPLSLSQPLLLAFPPPRRLRSAFSPCSPSPALAGSGSPPPAPYPAPFPGTSSRGRPCRCVQRARPRGHVSGRALPGPARPDPGRPRRVPAARPGPAPPARHWPPHRQWAAPRAGGGGGGAAPPLHIHERRAGLRVLQQARGRAARPRCPLRSQLPAPLPARLSPAPPDPAPCAAPGPRKLCPRRMVAGRTWIR